MGQYYKPIILESDKKTPVCYAYAHKCDNGLKLMEHSYIGNAFCNTVYNYIFKNGGANLVWAGDYADEEPNSASKEYPDENRNLYQMCEDVLEMEYDTSTKDYRYIINEDKHEYVDLWHVVGVGTLTINPLPLLTCEGNGRGGGDYWGLDQEYVGRWARDFIVVNEHSWPTHDKLEAEYTKIKPMFVEMSMVGTDLERVKEVLSYAIETGHEVDPDAWYMKDLRETAKDIAKLVDSLSEESTDK
jgi:hypothetical protein